MDIGAVGSAERRRWESENLGGYLPLCRHLEGQFGVEFCVEHSSGGCYAIVGRLNGHEVWLTMAICVLSTYAEHAELEAAGEHAGWAAGIYGPENDFCEPLGWAEDERMSINDYVGVVHLVRDALAHVPAASTTRP